MLSLSYIRYLTDRGVISCVVQGTTSQADRSLFPDSNNSSCVGCSLAVLGHVQALHLPISNSSDVLNVLKDGYEIWRSARALLPPGRQYDFLVAAETPREFSVARKKVIVTEIDEAIIQAEYPLTEADWIGAVENLGNSLTALFLTARSQPHGYIFTGQSSSVAFWTLEGAHFLFNSHAIDYLGLPSFSGNDVARVFRCSSPVGLAALLLSNSANDGTVRYFSLDRFFLTVDENAADLPPALGLQRTDLLPLTLVECGQPLFDQNKNEMSNVRRPGRPTKVKKGRKRRYSPDTLSEREKASEHERYQKRRAEKCQAAKEYSEAHPAVNREAAKRYSQSHPEVHRDAVRRYTEAHPEVHRGAVERYGLNHPEERAAADRSRHLPLTIRRGSLSNTVRGKALDRIQPYRLRACLTDPECPRCTHCNTRLFFEETGRKKWCCDGGRLCCLSLPPLEGEFYQDQRFLQHPRSYNDMFAMCALCVQGDWVHPSYGVSYIKLQGRTYHLIYDAQRPPTPGRPNFTSLFIDDGAERRRLAEKRNLNQQVIEAIRTSLSVTNPYVLLFHQLGEEASLDAKLVFRHVERRRGTNQFLDGDPTAEVAAIIATEEVPYEPRKLVVRKHGEGQQYIGMLSPFMEPLQYPLLFPHGNLGWTYDLKSPDGQKITQLKYMRYLLLAEERFSRYSRLSDTWLVDCYCRLEEERLRYITRCQGRPDSGGLRVAPAEELQAVVAGQGGQRSQVGRRTQHNNQMPDISRDETIEGEGGRDAGKVYLPSTFVGSKRYFKSKYLDSMGIVSRKGKPDFFLTFTASGSWWEYARSRQGTQTEAHICDRVFKLKLDNLLRDLRSGRFFGRPTYIIWVIEFQARGLPHAHICFRVEDNHRPLQSTDVDQTIRADIPSQSEAGGRLRQLVLKHMIHGPCGPPNRTNLPCWDQDNHRCKKYFPKSPTPVTFTDERGFWHYARDPNNTANIEVNGRNVCISDCDVVPYNSSLLLRYEAHINLEVATARRVIKYLFKYINKGNPLTRVRVAPEAEATNEVAEYVTQRYVGASDAAWRILEFDLTGREPTVETLPVHVESQQMLTYRRGREAEALESREGKLEWYFKRPTVPELDRLTYCQYYENYILHTKLESCPKRGEVWEYSDGNRWVAARQRGEAVCRLFWVAPNRGEQYYLRVLLNHFPCRGYADLLLLGGPECRTFQEAARAQGFVDDEVEYEEALTEAHIFMTGPSLRRLFVMLINIGAPARILWERNREILSEDLYEGDVDRSRAYTLALIQIDRGLRRSGSRNVSHGLPDVVDNITELGRELIAYDRVSLNSFVERWLPKLSPEQLVVFNYIKDRVEERGTTQGHSSTIFLDAPGGCGKTLLCQLIAAYWRERGVVVLCVASSGIAALHYTGGTTAHAMFRLPLEITDPRSVWAITNGSQRAELIKAARIIIYDEASMAHRALIEMLDRSLRDLMGNASLFGGKTVVFCGDFRQLAPVIPGAQSPSEIITASLRSSPLWPFMTKLRLSVGQRCRDRAYSDFLLEIGEARSPEIVLPMPGEDGRDEILVALDQRLMPVSTEADMINFVFPKETLRNPDECSSRAILCTHNNNVQLINQSILQSLPGEEAVLYSADRVADEESENAELYDVELLHEASGKGVPPHRLTLKKGSVCLVMRNLNPEEGLVNGAKVIVCELGQRLVLVRRPGSQERLAIPRILFKFPIYAGSHVEMYRKQYPLQLAYAMTIHKAQGQTIAKCALDLRSDCFAHGQLYVGLSRISAPSDMTICTTEHRVKDGAILARNVVFRELIDIPQPNPEEQNY